VPIENANSLWYGVLLFPLELIVGLIEQRFTNPWMELAAHSEGLMSGTFLIALGAIWTEVK
jgi:(hydroxyamino)benzene mutase